MYTFIQSLRFNIKLQENSNRHKKQAREAATKFKSSQVKPRPQKAGKEIKKKIMFECL